MNLPGIIFASLTVALLCLSLVAPIADAKTIEHSGYMSKVAHAQWEYTVGDIITFVSVTGYLNTLKDKPGGTTTDNFVVVSISRSNLVTSDVLLSAVGVTSDFQFTIGNHLKTAHLSATVILDDGPSFSAFPVTVDHTWTDTGEIVKDHTSHHRFQEDGFKFKSSFKGVSRNATASGTVFGAPGVVPEENFTRGPSTEGAIMDNKSSTLTIQTGGGQ